MPVHRFEQTRLPASAWMNRGGLTREVVCQPPQSARGQFSWRVSIASVVRDGPFSTFAGIDRISVLLDGEGLTLRSDDASVALALTTDFARAAYPGDVALECQLLRHGVRLFNVMTRRDRVHAEVNVLDEPRECPSSDRGVLFSARGRWRAEARDVSRRSAASVQLDAGIGVWWDGTPEMWGLTPLSRGATLIEVRVGPRPGVAT